MTVIIEIPEEIQARLMSEADACGVPVTQFVQDFLVDHYEEVEDRRIVESRLDSPQQPISGDELQNRLGLNE